MTVEKTHIGVRKKIELFESEIREEIKIEQEVEKNKIQFYKNALTEFLETGSTSVDTFYTFLSVDELVDDFLGSIYLCIKKCNESIDLLQSYVDNRIWINSSKKPILFPFSIYAKPTHSFIIDSEKNQYLYKDCLYFIEGLYAEEEKKLLIMEKFNKERRKFERLKNKHEKLSNVEYQRPSIPESVRIIVWKRDSGKCVRCGSRKNLEYDHIIPISKGGGNTARNIELLCEQCNRSKGAKIE